MVEFFGEKLQGFLVTKFGWVQSYGSRAVKPPIIYGDVKWTAPLTVDETVYAQSLTDKPVKGMLTGPVTILNWSFERVDLPRKVVQDQIALAINEEVLAKLQESKLSKLTNLHYVKAYHYALNITNNILKMLFYHLNLQRLQFVMKLKSIHICVILNSVKSFMLFMT